MAETVTITHVTHDLHKKMTIVVLTWDGQERRLSLPIPYGTALENVMVEAEKALRGLSEELAGTTLKLP